MTDIPHEEYVSSATAVETMRLQLQRFFRKVVAMFALLGATMAGTVWYVYHTTENNRSALCAYRADLDSRIATGKQFLIDNPNGIPGISAKTLQRSIDNEERAAKSFAVVDCPDNT